MSQFTIKKRRKLNNSYTGVLVFIAIVVLFFLAIGYTSDTALTRQEEALNNALERGIVHCYAQNGYYPPSLDYIKEEYGLQYDEEHFFVDYQPTASNMHPSYIVKRKGGKSIE